MPNDKDYILKSYAGRIVSLDINSNNGDIDRLILESKGIEDGLTFPMGIVFRRYLRRKKAG